jgi:lysophospholipase L1-like esterase
MSAASAIETVACLGSSTTAARGTYNWIAELQRRPGNQRFRFVNLGVGGDLSENALRRADRVIALQPDRIIVLIGTNDILASVFPNFWRAIRVWKRPSDEPTPVVFERNLERLTVSLRRQTKAVVGLCSLAAVGEDPHSTDPVQCRLNVLFAEYGAIVRDIAGRSGCYYIPFYECFQQQLEAARATKPFSRFSFRSFYRDYLVREIILGRSFDEISRINGWKFHIDGVHLNTDGGTTLVEGVQQFLDWAPG